MDGMKSHLLNCVTGGLLLAGILIYIYGLYSALSHNRQDALQAGFSCIMIFSVLVTAIRFGRRKEKITNKLVLFAVLFSRFFSWVLIAVLFGALLVRVWAGEG